MDDVLDSPLLKNLNFERAVNYAVRFIERIGIPQEFTEKTEVLCIKNYRALLPCDFFEMIQVRLVSVEGKGKHHHCHHGQKHDVVFRSTTDSFHMSPKHRDVNDQRDLTYKLQNSVIYTSIQEGEIEIAYRAMLVDEEGFPLIPDNSSFIDALGLFIKKQHAQKLVERGSLDLRVYQMIQQEYSFAVGQASADLIRPDLDKMEAITNMWNRLIPSHNQHNKSFVHEGTREYWRDHP